MIGEDGRIQWGALLSYKFALSLLVVTTNVVVLCEYLPQEYFLFGGLLKVIALYYCIVLRRYNESTLISCPLIII